MVPRPDLASSTYCLAEKSRQYLVYCADQAEVSVDLGQLSSESLECIWIDPHRGEYRVDAPISVAGLQRFVAPVPVDAVLLLKPRG
jgi:hypothetical protein